MNQKLKVALLVGGTSPERAISKLSGKAIYEALLKLKYEVTVIDPAYGAKQPESIDLLFNKEDYTEISNRNYVEAINSSLFDEIDIVFLALHGKWGEDGTIQSLLELRGKKYTGSKVLASALAMDKDMSKIIFKHQNISTASWLAIDKNGKLNNDLIEKIKALFGFPCVIKPNDQGSTVGLTICNNESEIFNALNLAFNFSEKVLIEQYIPGREITVAVLENQALPVLEIKPKHGVYDYECKYTSGMSEYEVPANIPESTFKQIQQIAIEAFITLGCSAYARVDFRLSDEMIPYCLEVNTLPGMTATSLVPKMAKAVGISFEDLVEKIIRLSLK